MKNRIMYARDMRRLLICFLWLVVFTTTFSKTPNPELATIALDFTGNIQATDRAWRYLYAPLYPQVEYYAGMNPLTESYGVVYKRQTTVSVKLRIKNPGNGTFIGTLDAMDAYYDHIDANGQIIIQRTGSAGMRLWATKSTY
jgi:hypothetical protein